jgi:hypothetical protein
MRFSVINKTRTSKTDYKLLTSVYRPSDNLRTKKLHNSRMPNRQPRPSSSLHHCPREKKPPAVKSDAPHSFPDISGIQPQYPADSCGVANQTASYNQDTYTHK